MSIFARSQWIFDRSVVDRATAYVNFFVPFTHTPHAPLTIHISADANYALYCNETLVDFGQFADYEDRKVYDTIDLAPYARTGENELRILVRSVGADFSTYRLATPGLIFAVYEGDTPVAVSSSETQMAVDESYATDVPRVSPQLGFTYECDLRVPVNRRTRPADLVEKPRFFVPRPVKKLTVTPPVPAKVTAFGSYFEPEKGDYNGFAARIMYAALRCRPLSDLGGADCRRLPNSDGIILNSDEPDADGVYAIVDLGAEHTGVLHFDVEVDEPTELLVGYGEHLDDLRVRCYREWQNFAVRLFLKSGKNTFTGPFLRLGVRYLQLHAATKKIKLNYFGVLDTEYPVNLATNFVCDDHLHNRIYAVACRTLHLCMHEHFEDCPWREQSLYTMDSRNEMLAAYYAFGDFDMARESLRLLAQGLRDDGYLELCAPARVPVTIPSFSAVFAVEVEEYLRFTNDTAFVREILPTLHRIYEHFARRTEEDGGLLKSVATNEIWDFYEWAEGLDGKFGEGTAEADRTHDAPMCAYYSLGLERMAMIEDRLGDPESAAVYRCRKAAIDHRFNEVFWDEAHGAYASFVYHGETIHYAELTNALAVYAGIASKERESRVLAALDAGGMIPISLSHCIYKYDALMKDPAKYAVKVFESVAEIWGEMIGNGATSFYETRRGSDDFNGAGSLCHGWSSVPVVLYFRYALGLSPDNGFRPAPIPCGVPNPKGYLKF